MSYRLLITGGCGFIGSNLVRYLLDTEPEIRLCNLDALTYSGNPANLQDLAGHPRYRFVHGNILDRPLVEGLLRESDGVAHLAAESHVDRSILDSRTFVESNVLGTQTLLDAARTVWGRGSGKRFLHVSTDEVYGSLPLDRPDLKFTEQSPLHTNSPYSASKAGSDLLALAYHQTHDLNVVITRCSNNFGPYQFPEKVIPLFVTNLLEGEPVPLYGDGLNVRDWLHVVDHCEALWRVLRDGRSGEVYNIGGNNERSNLELTRTILELLGKDERSIRYVPDRLGHDRRYAIDAGKIREEIGWEPSRSAWPGALAKTIRWYVEHPDWWRAVRERNRQRDLEPAEAAPAAPVAASGQRS
ncbi:MAG: dTDP-glucose 4,6-dehydratase [Planctomycetaceae bacterium]|nr:MAG: dTDP-glucose 4,6-dehydratase [Planctomycetaceae bacterium]